MFNIFKKKLKPKFISITAKNRDSIININEVRMALFDKEKLTFTIHTDRTYNTTECGDKESFINQYNQLLKILEVKDVL